MNKFSEEFKLRRKEKRLTHRALAKQLNLLSPSLLAQYEKGNKFPGSEELIKKISKALDWNEKSIFLSIQLEKAPGKAKNYFDPSQPTYPNLRELLIKRYSTKLLPKDAESYFVSDEKIVEILGYYPLHPIERILLQEIYDYLVEIGKAPGPGKPLQEDPIDYFNKFTEQGKKQRIEETKILWLYDKLHSTIALKLGNKELKWILTLPEERKRSGILQETILGFYIEQTPTQGRSYSKDLIKQIFLTDNFQRIEGKLLYELYRRISKVKNISISKVFKYFNSLSKEDLKKEFDKAKFKSWSYRLDDSLLMYFEDNNYEVAIFKLTWQKIDKNK